jgi:hypothetical protein
MWAVRLLDDRGDEKGKYVYHRCTGFKGACGNSYVREEQLSTLLEDVIAPIQITAEIANDIAIALRSSDVDAEQQRSESFRQLEQRRRVVVSKLDRGYEDYISGKISDEFWTRKSQEWEAELQMLDVERARHQEPRPSASITAEKI